MGPNGEKCGFCYYLTDPDAVEEYRGWCHYASPPYTPDIASKPYPDPTQALVSTNHWCSHFKVHPIILNKLLRAGLRDYDDKWEVTVERRP